MIETSKESREQFEIGLFGGTDIGNPYITGGIVEGFVRWRVSRWIQLGVQYNQYFSSRTSLAQAIEDDLNIQGVITRFPVAETAMYGQLTFLVFRGKLNFWGYKQVDLDFLATTGVGSIDVETRGSEFSYSWSITNRMGFSPSFAMLLGVSQDIVAEDTGLTYTRVSAGVSYSF